MNPTFAIIVITFRAAQDRALKTLRDEFRIPIPSSNRQWVQICDELLLYKTHPVNGVSINAHGYGVEVIYQDCSVDFDWGDHGEGNGFDAWRLWNHCEVNRIFLEKCDFNMIKSWLSAAFHANELVKDRLLYYLPHEHEADQKNTESNC